MTTATKTRNLDLERLELLSGSHTADSKFCLMEAVAYIAGEPWSDHPDCASRVIGAFGRRLNDGLPADLRQHLKPFIPRIVGTAASREVEIRRGYLAADWSIRVATPIYLRAIGMDSEAAALESRPEVRDAAGAREARTALVPIRDAARQRREKAWADLRAKKPAAAAYAADAADAADAAAAAAADAAADAAKKRLREITEQVLPFALDLLERMIEVRDAA